LNFAEFEENLRDRLKLPLPGKNAQHKMAPMGRAQTDIEKIDEGKVRKAAVLALFNNTQDKPHLILTLRSEYKGIHSGQISFPGGKKEKFDQSFMDTALRETHEEIGVPSTRIEILGEMTPLYIPPSNFFVRPFIGLTSQNQGFIPEEAEVEKIINLNFNELLHPKAISEQEISARGFKLKVPAFPVEKHFIWGATAMMISELREMFLENNYKKL